MFKVIVAGTRDFGSCPSDYDLMVEKLDLLLSKVKGKIEIVSGTARGADRLGERYARSKGYPIKRFPADWDTYGKSAGYKRNKQMAEYADALVAFWDESSAGTKHMIDLAREQGIQVRVIKYLPF